MLGNPFVWLIFFQAAKTSYSDDFTLDDRFVSSAANQISPAQQEQQEKDKAIRGACVNPNEVTNKTCILLYSLWSRLNWQ